MHLHRTDIPEAMTRLPDIVRSAIDSSGLTRKIAGKASLFLPLVSIVALAAGVLLSAASDGLSSFATSAAATLIDGYSFLAPALIFMVLAPVLSRIFSTRERGRFGLYVVGWLAATKVLAMLWVVLFTVVVFGLPLMPESSVSFGATLRSTTGTLVSTLASSHFFWAIYAAVAAGLVAVRVQSIAATLERGVTSIEYAGQYLQPAIPLFMFAVGVYVGALPEQLNNQIGLEGVRGRLSHGQHPWTAHGSQHHSRHAGDLRLRVAAGGGRLVRVALRNPGTGQVPGAPLLVARLLR